MYARVIYVIIIIVEGFNCMLQLYIIIIIKGFNCMLQLYSIIIIVRVIDYYNYYRRF